MLYFGFN